MERKEINSLTEVLDRSTLMSIGMLSILVSLLSLSIPISAQTLINLIAFGKLLQPVVMLSLIVLVLMLALGALNIWQFVIIEIISQKLMVKISLSLTRQFTHLSLKNFTAHHGPELVNRYFEVVTIMKAMASLLLYGINLSLQLIFGLVLLLFYHPFFLGFDLLILFGLALSIWLPYRRGLSSAKDECTQKHQVGAWLEELLTSRYLFRFDDNDRFATQQADKRLVAFLRARNMHFRQLIKHHIGFYLLSALASSLLLGLGGYLVIQNQLSLGQLVAAEIVLGALIYSFRRFGVLLENYYDLIASEGKIDTVLNLPVEPVKNELSNLFIPIQSLTLQFRDGQEVTATPTSPLLICAETSSQCRAFTDFLLGFDAFEGMNVLVNQSPCHELHRRSLRQHAVLIRDPEWIAGTIRDNLVLGRRNVSDQELVGWLIEFGLMDKIMEQADGLDTMVYEWQSLFDELELLHLLFIRAMLAKPQLLVIDRALDNFKELHIAAIVNRLAQTTDCIVLIVTQHFEYNPFANRLVIS